MQQMHRARRSSTGPPAGLKTGSLRISTAVAARRTRARASAAAPGQPEGDSEPSTSGASSSGAEAGAEPSQTVVASLERLFQGSQPLTGAELTALIRGKTGWGARSYEARIQKRGNRVFLHIMWKFLEQQSFHMTREQYDDQMNAVADLVSEWGCADLVRRAIESDKSRGPGLTAGGAARAVSIPLPIDTSGTRRSEWRY